MACHSLIMETFYHTVGYSCIKYTTYGFIVFNYGLTFQELPLFVLLNVTGIL